MKILKLSHPYIKDVYSLIVDPDYIIMCRKAMMKWEVLDEELWLRSEFIYYENNRQAGS